MPLVGAERVAGLLRGTPARRLLQLHTYTLLATEVRGVLVQQQQIAFVDPGYCC